MIHFVNPHRQDKLIIISEEVVKATYKILLDEYDDDGNTFWNNPK